MADPSAYDTPRWVKVLGIVILVLVLLAGIMLFTGLGGPHGPRRHAPPDGPGGRIPPSSAADGHTHPVAALAMTHRQ